MTYRYWLPTSPGVTITEMKAALDRLSDEQFAEFRRAFGGDHPTRQGYVNHFVHHPGHERQLCELLGTITQEERQTAAALISSQAAADSARSARYSMIWPALAVIVSLVSLSIASC